MKKTILYLICVISLAGNMFAQEESRIATIQNKLEVLKVEVPGLTEKVNVNITNTTLSNFLLAVSQVHNININVDQSLNNISIVNGFNDVTVSDLLVFLVKEYDLAIDFTGNILSVRTYQKPIEQPKPKEIKVAYDYSGNTLSMDLTGDPLSDVFRKIMDSSGKNLLFSPQIKSLPLSIYVNSVPFESALDKLSIANGLEFEKTDDGFYVFNSLGGVSGTNSDGTGNSPQRIRPRRKKGNFFYEILDADSKEISVDFQDTPIADIVYTLADELKLDIFTASPIENAGTATVKAERINFDELLTKIFDSSTTSAAPTNFNNQNSDDQNGQFQNRPTVTSGGSFTFKKEGNLYYFGTEQQLTLKRIELVTMMHRSVELLGDASQNGGQSRYSGNFSNSNGINYFGGGARNGFSQNGGLNATQNSLNGFSNSSGFQNNRNSNSFSGINQNYDDTDNSTGGSGTVGAITSLFPNEILNGLDIKVDTELNGFVVSGSSNRVEKFKNFIKYIDKPVPVILIEVMILEVSRNATVDTGVEFGLKNEPTNDQGVAFPRTDLSLGAQTVNRIIGGFDGFGSLNLGNVRPNFYLDIKAMESSGNLKILSTPKLSTLNGHKAYLSSGQTTYFEVTNQNFFGSQIPQTSQITNYQPIDAELALEFKPFVSGDGQITLDIQVIQSSFGARTAANAPPDINSRRFSSIIRMQDKDVAILGGIEEKFKNDSGTGVPLLSRIPVLKWLFSTRTREDRKKKLNILVKPTVFY